MTVAVCIPTIPGRERLLARAEQSARLQTRTPDEICITLDDEGLGAAETRNRAWRLTDCDWVAFLDDDDELRDVHLERLLMMAEVTGADLVYPWFNIIDAEGYDITRNDPLRIRIGNRLVTPFGLPFGDAHVDELRTRNNFIPVTVLVRRALLDATGGFPSLNSSEWPENCCEDWALWRRLLDVGATFAHLPERTWLWHWHGHNTSGRSWRNQRLRRR